MLARGNHVMEGYWEQPEATAARASTTAGSTPATAASSTTRTTLTISDRKKDVIISGGENVSSIEVEDCIFSHPAVAEVCVIGVPDEKWGETVMALVVLGPGARRDRGRDHRALPEPARALQVPERASSSATRSRARRPASSRSSSSARRTGKAASASSTDPDRNRAVQRGGTLPAVSPASYDRRMPPRQGRLPSFSLPTGGPR